jgi:thiol-disulfide isomerase/thioredoxin
MTLQLGAQTKTVRIKGTIKDTTVKSIGLTHPVDAKLSKWEYTKINVVNGAFDTSIQLSFPAEISITIGMMGYRNKFISSDAEILVDADGKLHIKGSPMQDEYEKEFLPFFQSNDKVFDSLQSFYGRNYEKYGRDFPSLTKDSANLLIKKYYSQRAELLGEYIKMHPDSYVALWNVYYLVSITPTHQYFDFEKLFSSFSNQMQQQSFIHLLREKMKASATIQEGQLFPKEFFKGYEQMESKIKNNNRYYLIDFWFSHCAPCIKEFPRLKKLYNQFHQKGFDIVSISVDKLKDEKDYLASIKKYGLPWNQVWDKDGVTAEKFNINAFPTYILLDNKGRIIISDIRADQLEAFLKENLR